MELRTYKGESIAKNLTVLGLSSTFIKKTISCTTIKYHFNLVDITKLAKIEKIVKMLSANCHEQIKVLPSKIGHFCLEFVRKQREFPTFFETHSALKGKKDGEFIVGIDEDNNIVTKNIEDCPHLLVSGQTGSGKSIFLNTFISCINCYSKNTKLILIDPKQVEFSQFENSPRLACPIITSVNGAILKLNQLCNIMDERYNKLRSMGLQNNKNCTFEKIICVIDELADLMLTSGKQIEEPIVRIAQKGRACGIHLILATQRPTVNVVTGLIKANIPTRIAFTMASVRDSIVVLDKAGANELQGKGDCLVKFADEFEIKRMQAPYIDAKDIEYTLKDCKPRIWSKTQQCDKNPHHSAFSDSACDLSNNVVFWQNKCIFDLNNNIADFDIDLNSLMFYDCIEND